MPEFPDHMKTAGHRRAEAEQRRLIAEVQFHLRERGVDIADREVWQHGIAVGPFSDTESWAGSVLAMLAAPLSATEREALAHVEKYGERHSWTSCPPPSRWARNERWAMSENAYREALLRVGERLWSLGGYSRQTARGSDFYVKRENVDSVIREEFEAAESVAVPGEKRPATPETGKE